MKCTLPVIFVLILSIGLSASQLSVAIIQDGSTPIGLSSLTFNAVTQADIVWAVRLSSSSLASANNNLSSQDVPPTLNISVVIDSTLLSAIDSVASARASQVLCSELMSIFHLQYMLRSGFFFSLLLLFLAVGFSPDSFITVAGNFYING